MDINKNSFTFGFTIIMVIIVSALLSIAYIKLKPYQDRNIELEKKQNILSSVGITVDRDNAEAKYSTYIKSEIVLNNQGEEVEGSAFDVDLGKEIKKDVNTQLLPLFISEVDVTTRYIIPLRGKGLWGPILVCIALDDDLQIRIFTKDGTDLQKGQKIATLEGNARQLLKLERILLNLLQRLSGIATLTKKYVNIVNPSGIKILDTRKTTPGLRLLEKYAVKIGGGYNHRLDLSSGLLIKDNHWIASKENFYKIIRSPPFV